MAIALVIAVLVAASLLFHLVSPWWVTPLASNWQRMDDTLAITVVVTGIFFVLIHVFLVYTLLRYRHRPGRRSVDPPESHRLERGLLVLTTVGIAALLAPGLAVYAAYVRPPEDALVVEALAQQWQWRFRLPGADGKLGATDVRFVSTGNPFGLDPDDPAGHANRLVPGNELHLPLQRPVRLLLRSTDVLHDFYVPEFRARMNIVPGTVTGFWFTPTRAGRYELMCAQLCGVGHYNMRAVVVVEPEAAFRAWQQSLPTFAARAAAHAGTPPLSPLAARGQALAQSRGCVACHSADGSAGVGPTWKGLYGKTETLADGRHVAVDDAYLRRAIREPQADVVQGFAPVMPASPMTDDELAAMLDYLHSLSATKETR